MPVGTIDNRYSARRYSIWALQWAACLLILVVGYC